MMEIDIVQDDITKLNVDAIVNAANSTLLGGGGVDGAIHRAAGPKLLEECKKIRKEQYPRGLPTGRAVITRGYDLPAKYVIHTVGPVHSKGSDRSALLKSCFVECLKLGERYELASVAFPAISCGVYGYPMEEAAHIARQAIEGSDGEHIKKIYLCLFDKAAYNIFRREFGR